MTGAVTIRRASDSDAGAIFALYRELAGAYGGTSEDASQEEKLWQEVAADARQHILVAEQAAVVVGTLTLIIIPNLGHHGQPWAAVENVVVDSRLQGQGIGKALMAEAGRIARDHQCYKLVLSSNLIRKDAHEFYRRQGWRQTHSGFSLDLD